MFQAKDVEKKYNQIAEWYEKSFLQISYDTMLRDFFVSAGVELLNSESSRIKILDVGSGTGITIRELQKLYPQAEIIGLDLAGDMLQVCRAKVPACQLVIGNYNDDSPYYDFDSGEAYTFARSDFDLVVSTGSLTEYGKLDVVLPFLYDVLKPGGTLINVGHKKSLYNWLVLQYFRGIMHSPNHFMRKCDSYGFCNVSRIKAGNGVKRLNWRKYGVVATKVKYT